MADTSFNILSICSGIGALDLGIRLAVPHARTVCVVERECYAAAVLEERMREGALDACPIWLGDLGAFDGRPWCGAVDCVIAGLPCFAAGTMVLCDSGYVPIEEITVGSRVLTHTGRWRSVTAVMRRDDAPLRRIKAQGVPGVVTTDEHPFFARVRGRIWNNNKRQDERLFHEPKWTRAVELTRDHFVAQVLPKEQKDYRSVEWWWLVGRYLGDGWMVRRKTRGAGKVRIPEPNGKVIICCAKDETEELQARIIAAGLRSTKVEEPTVNKLHIGKTAFYRFVLQFGRLAHGKRLPGFCLELDRERAKALLDGWLSADGHRERNLNESRGTTVSKSLALGMALLAQRAYGVVATVRRQKRKPKTTIEGRVVNQRDDWQVHIPDHNRSGFVDGNTGWKLVRSSEPCGNGPVYNLAVEEDESYVADGAIVHNCQPYSVAGRRKGSEDERYIWPDFFRILREVRPALVFLENVPGLLRWFRPIGEELSGMGYEFEAGIFSASEVGAPQKRERLFILAHRSVAHASSDGGREVSRGQRENGAEPESCNKAVADAAGTRWTAAGGSGFDAAFEPSAGCRAMADAGREGLSKSECTELRGPRWADEGGATSELSGSPLADPANDNGRGGVVPGEEEIWPGWRGGASGEGGELADAGCLGFHGLQPERDAGIHEAPEPPGEGRGLASLPLFPPGPGERERWAEILERWPELAPAVSGAYLVNSWRRLRGLPPLERSRRRKWLVGGKAPDIREAAIIANIRRDAPGLRNRLDRLRALGNCVIPEQAAKAFLTLAEKAGILNWLTKPDT